ncbi:MAG TPA: hypothetical protein VET25_11250, partial [Aestuariivirgaceae bacterium]|nr:hypothetical protein [Aestuariivirgaceae bacterium]
VAAGTLFDGWGKAAVQTLSMYYAADTSQSDVEMLGYRAAFLPVSGPKSAMAQMLFGNYFAGETGQGNFIGSKVEADVLGQWGFAYDPNLAGSQHVFRDDAGRVRFFRSNPDLANMTSQGFRYVKYDQWSRVTEFGVLLNVAKGALADYADWARDADLDRQLTKTNACPVILIVYDVDPSSGTVLAYDERRGGVARRSYYPTAIADQPVSCPGRGTSDPVQESLYQYDDLGRGTLLSEHRRDEGSDVYRTTAHSWPGGGLTPQMVFPDEDHSQAFATSGQGSVTGWPDLLGRTVRVCAGEDCSGVKYVDITQFRLDLFAFDGSVRQWDQRELRL